MASRNHITYDSFGNVLSETHADVDTLFTSFGRFVDTATGNRYHGNRWCTVYYATWLSPDPIGFEGGDANLYRYCGGDPLNETDPFGLAREKGKEEQEEFGLGDFAWGFVRNWLLGGWIWDSARAAPGAAQEAGRQVGEAMHAAENAASDRQILDNRLQQCRTPEDFKRVYGDQWQQAMREAAALAEKGVAVEAASAAMASQSASATAARASQYGPNRVSPHANFAQSDYREAFSKGGRFAGMSVDDVAAALRSGQLRPSDVPVEYIFRNGKQLILNTRSAEALRRAGIPRSQWFGVNRTGNTGAELRLDDQLKRNGLNSQGTPVVEPR